MKSYLKKLDGDSEGWGIKRKAGELKYFLANLG